MIELGQRLRTMREERGLTQQDLARAAGIATDMVSRLENGHYTSPGLRTLLRIAEGMGISVSALLPDVPNAGHAAPEAALKARLAALLHRVEFEDLELLVDLATTVVNRNR
jgi:transcriptional regulator with XRE-family HTH domain